MPLKSPLLRPSHALALGFGAAVMLAAYVVGWRVLNPLDTSWIVGDTAQGYMGWLFLNHQDSLGWPLGFARDLGAPLGKQVAYLDGSPLYVTLLWPFRSILPESFQYFGVVFLVHCALQFYFGYKISMQLMNDDHRAALFGGLLFLTAPVFIWRAHGHFALSAHWLILGAFYVFFSQLLAAPIKGVVVSGLLVAIAGGINPYITYMTLLVIGAAYLKRIITAPTERRLQVGGVAVLSMLALAATALTVWLLFGFIDLGDPGAAVGAGYDMYSMDLLSIINPMGYPSLLLPKISIGIGQYEGYNYLGLGVLGLALACVAINPDILRKAFRRSALPAWIILLLSLLLALSTKATVAGAVLYELKLPEGAFNALNAFRGSGRLFWPAFYLLTAITLYAAYATFTKRILAILILALVVQVLDVRSLYASIRQQWATTQSAAFTDKEPWQSLPLRHRHLVVIPAWQCGPHMAPGGKESFWIFGRLAGMHGMSINSFYSGRFSTKQSSYFCDEQPRQIEAQGLRDDTAYVFARRGNLIGLRRGHHVCRRVDGVILCSREPGREDHDELQWPPFRVGDTVQFSGADDERVGLDAGWYGAEAWGRWSQKVSRLSIVLQEPAKEIVLQAIPFISGSITSQRILATLNGVELPEQAIAKEGELSFPIPEDIGTHPGEIVLQMQFPDAQSPASLGLSRDVRVFALGVKSITVR